MPNWCESQLMLSGSPEVVLAATKQLTNLAADFRDFYLDHRPRDWRVALFRFWAAKWPPRGEMLGLSEEFPELLVVLRFIEPLGNYTGVMVCQAGEVLWNRVDDLSSEWREMPAA